MGRNKQEGRTLGASSLNSLGATLRSKSFQNKITKEQLPKLAGIAFSKTMPSSNRLQQLWRRSFSIRPDTNNSLTREEVSLGSSEAEPQATELAYRSPKHNDNTSSLGIGTKNKAAYGILIDTGAAISLAPRSFAQDVELSPIESTLQPRTVTGQAIEAFGRRTVQLVGPNLSFQVSFVIANVQHALLGLDALMINQLSLIRNNFNEYYLVNTAGATIQLQTKGHLLHIEACPREFGFSNCRGSSFPKENGSLLDDKSRTQEVAVPTSGGACENSFYLENLRQQQDKNTAALGNNSLAGTRCKEKKKKEEEETFCPQKLLRIISRGALSRTVRHLQQATLGT